MKKRLATLLLIAVMVLTGVGFMTPEAHTAEAAGTEVSFIAEKKSIREYRSQSGYTYPKLTTQGKESWIFAGWYKDEACTTPYTEETIVGVTDAWAKYVPSEVLSVKCQVTAGTDAYSDKTDMRFLTTVDSTLYSEVGFEITSNSKTYSFSSTTVFKRINSAIDGLECGFNPVTFDVESKYFMTFTIKNILNKYFDRIHFVRPYWVTMDGTTVYGLCRNTRVSDSYNNIANIPVRLYSDATLSAGSLQVAYDSTKFEYLEYEVGNVDAGAVAANSADNTYVTCNVSEQVSQKPDGMLVNLRFKIIGDIASNTTFTVTNNSVSDSSSSVNIPVSNSIYKIYVLVYDGTNADTSWYDEFAADTTHTKFTIATAADLYGFAELVNGGNNFAGKTVYLAADITVNKGDASNWKTSGAAYTWTPIGSFALARNFNGTFDGQGQSISGLYFNSDARGLGLFGFTGAGSVIQNVKLEKTYFCATSQAEVEMGGIAGRSFGTIQNVYVADDVYLDCHGYYCGGIAGYNQYGTNKSYSNCWFDGNIDMQTTGRWGGGIIGYLHKDATKLDMSHCLFSGTLTTAWNSSGAQIGGLVGCTAISMDISDCLISGSVTSTGNQYAFGAVFGSTTAGTTLNITDVFADKASSKYTVGNSADGAGGTIAKIMTYENANLMGYNGYQNLKNLGIYTLNNTATTNNWVMRSGDVPALKYWVKDWIDVSWYEAATSGSDTFIISTVEELYGFAELSQTINFQGDTVKLGADIEVNRGNAANWSTDAPARVWEPAAKSNFFAGTFDGNGKTISGLYVNETTAFSGLFGMVGGTVQNLRIENSYIYGAGACAGSVAGACTGNVSNVYSEAFVVTAASECGGIVGRYIGGSTATISGCWYAGTVSAKGQYCGGIVGGVALGTKTISNCLVTGNVSSTVNNWAGAGGIVGGVNGYLNNGATVVTVTVTDCISAAKVRTAVTNGAGSVLGRAVAGAGNQVTFDRVYTTDNSYYGTGEIATAKTMVGVGDYTYATVTGTPIKKTVSDLTGANGYKNTMLSFELTDGDGGTWVAIADSTPELAYFSDATISDLTNVLQVHTDWYYNNKSGTANVYNISTVADFYGFAQIVNSGVQFDNATVNLLADITVNNDDASKWAATKPAHVWEPIGSVTANKKFNGIFEGNGHSISGLYVSSGDIGLGLFGFTGANAYVQNLKLANSYFCGTATGDVELGAIVGRGLGNVSNVYVSNDVYMDCHGFYCGGIVGRNPFGANKVYSKCWFAGNIDMKTTGRQGGGILGSIGKETLSMNDCLFTGTITTANTTAGPQVGGLIGQVNAAVALTDCLSAGSVTSSGSAYTYGSVFGFTNAVTITLTDVYEADDDCPYIIGQGSNTSGMATSAVTCDKSSLLGYGGYYELGSVFDFTNTWIAVQGSVPQLKGWGQTALDLAEGAIDTTWKKYYHTVFRCV